VERTDHHDHASRRRPARPVATALALATTWSTGTHRHRHSGPEVRQCRSRDHRRCAKKRRFGWRMTSVHVEVHQRWICIGFLLLGGFTCLWSICLTTFVTSYATIKSQLWIRHDLMCLIRFHQSCLVENCMIMNILCNVVNSMSTVSCIPWIILHWQRHYPVHGSWGGRIHNWKGSRARHRVRTVPDNGYSRTRRNRKLLISIQCHFWLKKINIIMYSTTVSIVSLVRSCVRNYPWLRTSPTDTYVFCSYYSDRVISCCWSFMKYIMFTRRTSLYSAVSVM